MIRTTYARMSRIDSHARVLYLLYQRSFPTPRESYFLYAHSRHQPTHPRFIFYASSGLNFMLAPFMQYLSPVLSRGPSSKTCPRWPWQFAHRTSVRGRKTME